MHEIRSIAGDPDRAHLIPYTTTRLERDLALRLGIPMYGADPRTFALGTKSGARRIFAEAGVPHPLGVEGLRTADDLIDYLTMLSWSALCGIVEVNGSLETFRQNPHPSPALPNRLLD